MLKLEDLKVGDELTFISDKARQEFIKRYNDNKEISNLFTPNNTIVEVDDYEVVLRGSLIRGSRSLLFPHELKYFRKVVPVTTANTDKVSSTKVNANIKDIKEMYTRLLDGEVFYRGGSSIKFNGKIFEVTYYDDEKVELKYMAEMFKDFLVEQPWYANASEENPILCKVWGDGNEDVAMVTGKRWDGYATYSRGFWENARPVLPSECYQGE